MVSSLRVEDRLDGATNFRSWKTMILFILDENEIQREECTDYQDVQPRHWYMTVSVMEHGIIDFLTYITGLFQY
jgi:hypothetical protein